MSRPLFPFVLSLSKGVNETGRLPRIWFDRLTMNGQGNLVYHERGPGEAHPRIKHGAGSERAAV